MQADAPFPGPSLFLVLFSLLQVALEYLLVRMAEDALSWNLEETSLWFSSCRKKTM
jgi:hypothetical protein